MVGQGRHWELAEWLLHFPHRRNLRAELALLKQLFPDDWYDDACSARPAPSRPSHQLRGDLLTPGGRTRVLDLAGELLRLARNSISLGGAIPMQGRLRNTTLYAPTKSELLVGSILRPLGDMRWQPEGAGFGADYSVEWGNGAMVAEVKRLETARAHAREEAKRLALHLSHSNHSPPQEGFLFTRAETSAMARDDARRLYPHVRKAARQLDYSAKRLGPAGTVPGILFLDLDGNTSALNVEARIRRWMALPWASSIDLVMWFDYRDRDGRWGTIAQPLFSRTPAALSRLQQFHHPCSRGHAHIRSRPRGSCADNLPF